MSVASWHQLGKAMVDEWQTPTLIRESSDSDSNELDRHTLAGRFTSEIASKTDLKGDSECNGIFGACRALENDCQNAAKTAGKRGL